MAQLVSWSKSPLVKGDIPVAIISLEDAKARRSTLIDRGVSSDLVNGFWPACDMRDQSDSNLKNYRHYQDINNLYGRPPLAAELGCLFSHISVIKWLSGQDSVSQVIIFEDDIIPEMSGCFDTLHNISNALMKPANAGVPFICHLGPRPEEWRSSFTRKISKACIDISGFDTYDFVDKKGGLWRAHAYIISKEAAIRYTEAVKSKGFLADDWGYIGKKTQSKIYFIDPPLFVQDEEVESTIDPDQKRKDKGRRRSFFNRKGDTKVSILRHPYLKFARSLKKYLKGYLAFCYRRFPAKKIIKF